MRDSLGDCKVTSWPLSKLSSIDVVVAKTSHGLNQRWAIVLGCGAHRGHGS